MLDIFTLQCDMKWSHKIHKMKDQPVPISVTLQQLYRCERIHMQIFTKEHRANTTTETEMERS